MKAAFFYGLLFALVFIATYSLAPTLGLGNEVPPDQIMQTPFQDFRGLIRV